MTYNTVILSYGKKLRAQTYAMRDISANKMARLSQEYVLKLIAICIYNEPSLNQPDSYEHFD